MGYLAHERVCTRVFSARSTTVKEGGKKSGGRKVRCVGWGAPGPILVTKPESFCHPLLGERVEMRTEAHSDAHTCVHGLRLHKHGNGIRENECRGSYLHGAVLGADWSNPFRMQC